MPPPRGKEHQPPETLPAAGPATISDDAFKEWSLAVAEQLRDVSRVLATLQESSGKLDAEIRRLGELYTGGHNTEKGLMFRFLMLEKWRDELQEQAKASITSRAKEIAIHAVITAVITILVTAVIIGLKTGALGK